VGSPSALQNSFSVHTRRYSMSVRVALGTASSVSIPGGSETPLMYLAVDEARHEFEGCRPVVPNCTATHASRASPLGPPRICSDEGFWGHVGGEEFCGELHLAEHLDRLLCRVRSAHTSI